MVSSIRLKFISCFKNIKTIQRYDPLGNVYITIFPIDFIKCLTISILKEVGFTSAYSLRGCSPLR